MDDLISRQAAIDTLTDMHCKSDEDGYVWIIRSDAWARIDALPSVTPTKIVAQINIDNAKLKEIADEAVKRLEEELEPKRKTGKWETVEDWDGDEHYRCSECGAEFVLIDGTPENNDYYFCPHCGARMTEEDV